MFTQKKHQRVILSNLFLNQKNYPAPYFKKTTLGKPDKISKTFLSLLVIFLASTIIAFFVITARQQSKESYLQNSIELNEPTEVAPEVKRNANSISRPAKAKNKVLEARK